jgi:hypothetical protein
VWERRERRRFGESIPPGGRAGKVMEITKRLMFDNMDLV